MGRRALLGMLGARRGGRALGRQGAVGDGGGPAPRHDQGPTGLAELLPVHRPVPHLHRHRRACRAGATPSTASPSTGSSTVPLQLDCHRRPRTAPPDLAHPRLPVRHRMAGRGRALAGREAGRPARRAWARRPSATHVRFWSFDGAYTETLTIDQARRDDVLIAHRCWAGRSRASTAGRSASTWHRCTATSRSSGSSASRSSTPSTSPPTRATGSALGYDVDAWVGRSNGRSDGRADVTHRRQRSPRRRPRRPLLARRALAALDQRHARSSCCWRRG